MSQFDGLGSRWKLAACIGAVSLINFIAGAGLRDGMENFVQTRRLTHVMNNVAGANENTTRGIAEVLTGEDVQKSISEQALRKNGIDPSNETVREQVKVAGFTLAP